MDRIHAKVGDRNSMYFGRIIYHRGRDGDDKLASQDVNGGWVAGGISGNLDSHLMGRSNVVLF